MLQVDNGDLEAKVMVRKAALDAAGPGARVLDCYAGEGHMYRNVWHEAAEYLGIEKRFARPKDSPAGRCMKGDNVTLLGRAMQISEWNVVDLDAYGNPWPLLRKVLKLARGQRLVVTLTCGIDRSIRVGSNDFAAALAGLSSFSYTGLLTRWYDDVIRWAVAWAVGGTRWRVSRARVIQGQHNAQMRYWLLEFERPEPSAAA